MPVHWFRIAYARNAFLRSAGPGWRELSLAAGVRAMTAFHRDFRPQHGERDILAAHWGPVGDRFEYTISRRMSRHDHTDTTLALVYVFADSPSRPAPGSSSDVRGNPAHRALARASVLERRLEVMS